MRVLSRHALATWLAQRGVDQDRLTWRDSPAPFRMLVRESQSEEIDVGPHRRVSLPDEGTFLKVRLGDRPALGAFVDRAFSDCSAQVVCACGEPESYWLNNRGYAAYLSRVEDARRIHRCLGSVGLSNKFRGGFLVRPFEYGTHLPMLAAQPFCGGPDVLFTSEEPPLLILACHEFDLHVEARDPALANRIEALAADSGLDVRRSDLLLQNYGDMSD